MKIEVKQKQNKKPERRSTGSRSAPPKKVKRLKTGTRVLFYRQLSSLIGAGMDLHNSLLLLEQDANKKIKALMAKVRKDVESGESLASALSNSGYFTSFECESIRASEESGMLHEVLNELLSYYVFRQKLKRTIVGAASYPLLLVFVASGVIVFMLNVVVPMFEDIYGQMGRELPAITKNLIAFSDAFRNSLPYFLIGIAAAIVIYKYLARNDDWKVRFEKINFNIPVAGKLYKNLIKSRICSLMHFLTKAGLPLNNSLMHTANSIENVYYRRRLTECVEKIKNGAALTDTLGELPVFTTSEKTLIRLGEETNRLGSCFEQLSNSMSEQLEYEAGMMNKILEPVLISLVAVFIAIILIALYLPLFNISF